MAQRTLALPPARVRVLLRWLALVLLVGGFATAVSIWIAQDRMERRERARHPNRFHEATILDPLAPEDSNRYAQNVELYYGKSGLLMDKATRWLEHLGQGKPLAWTLGTASVVLAGAFFLAAALYRPDRLHPAGPGTAGE